MSCAHVDWSRDVVVSNALCNSYGSVGRSLATLLAALVAAARALADFKNGAPDTARELEGRTKDGGKAADLVGNLEVEASADPA